MVPALSVIDTRVPPSSTGSGKDATLATLTARPDPKVLAIDSGATVRPPKLAADTVATAGPAARHARLVSTKIAELTVIENSTRNLRRRGWTIVRIRRDPRTLGGRASKDGAREIHRRFRKIDRLNQIVGRSRSSSYRLMKLAPFEKSFRSMHPPWSDTPSPFVSVGHRTVTSIERVP